MTPSEAFTKTAALWSLALRVNPTVDFALWKAGGKDTSRGDGQSISQLGLPELLDSGADLPVVWLPLPRWAPLSLITPALLLPT